MPRFLQPRQSSQHRVAAIALYRALLSQCSTAPLDDTSRVSLRNAIRNKFRKNTKITSPYQLGLSFKAGYETLDHLDGMSNNDAASTQSLTSLISKLPKGLIRTSRPKARPSPAPAKERLHCLLPERAVLNVRPYARTTGPRHVPILSSANGVPFLRLTKPQPPALSRVLRQRLERKMNLFHMKVMLGNWWSPMAKQEDEWDALIEAHAGKNWDSAGPDDRVKWVDAVRMSERENQSAYERDLGKDREITRKMQRIVDRETELALKEGRSIVRGRRKRPIRIIRPKE